MQMTDTEILGKYNRSDDKKGVVQILADLNGCDKDTIQQILIQGGVPESEVANLRSQVMELEKRSDEIIDFLNGEAV